MKKLQIIIAIIGITLFSVQNMFAQAEQKAQEIVYKTTQKELPQKVKETLKNYSGYKISEEVSFKKKSNDNIYKIKITKGNWSHYLIINENGKITGTETREHVNE